MPRTLTSSLKSVLLYPTAYLMTSAFVSNKVWRHLDTSNNVYIRNPHNCIPWCCFTYSFSYQLLATPSCSSSSQTLSFFCPLAIFSPIHPELLTDHHLRHLYVPWFQTLSSLALITARLSMAFLIPPFSPQSLFSTHPINMCVTLSHPAARTFADIPLLSE